MNATLRVTIAVILIAVITFSGITVAGHVFKGFRADVTEQHLYTLSQGTKNILGKLAQPITLKLYYSKTGANKGPDQIRFYNEYYFYVKALLEEYVKHGNSMVKLEVIDPRPFSDDEADAMQYGLTRLQVTQDESFFFGLVLQTQLGVTKTIEMFQPQRQQFVEYDISYLIDTAITRDKQRLGVLSSLPVLGENLSPYMRQMMQMQGQQAQNPWTIIQHLREKYDIQEIDPETEKIEDIDVLLVIHPKDLQEKALFAIDQFVLAGGRTIVCIDPFCFEDRPPAMMAQDMQAQINHKTDSNLEPLLHHWGLEMPERTFAGDRSLAQITQLRRDAAPEKFIGLLQFGRENMNRENPISSELNEVQMLFPGVLRPLPMDDTAENAEKIERTPLIQTTDQGNAWTVDSLFEVRMGMDASRLMQHFTDGDKSVAVAYALKGHFTSAYPNGIEVKDEEAKDDTTASESDDAKNKEKQPPKTHKLTGLTETAEGEQSVVAVFADVDFLTDSLAYSRSFFGMAAVRGDNSALLMNTIESLSGSADLLAIRSRGNYQRPFKVIDDIEAQAEAETAEKIAEINARIAGFQNELQEITSQVKQGQEELIGAEILKKKKELELKIHEAQGELRRVQQRRREKIEAKESELMKISTAAAPTAILLLAIVLSIQRNVRRRYYVSHPREG